MAYQTNLIVPESTVPGTRAWAETVVDNARAYASFTEKDVRPLVERYLALCEHGVWETWFADEPKTLERFCREALGYDTEFLETMSNGVAILEQQGHSGPVSVEDALQAVRLQALARETRQDFIAAADAVPLPRRGRPEKTSNRRFNAGSPTSESYLRRRLKRDKPDLYQRVLLPKGDPQHLSAHAAAVKAKIRPGTISVRADDPKRAARTLRKHYRKGTEQLALLIRWLQEDDDDAG